MSTTTNQKILLWARGKKGQQVGRGECWDLADQALRQAGANSSPTSGEDDDYTWGAPVALKDLQPGDVLQFRDYTVVTSTETVVTFEDESGSVDTVDKTVVREHHTAIVDAVLQSGVLVWEQNVQPLGKKVQKHIVPLADGSPPPTTTKKLLKHASGKMKFAMVTVTVTVTVSGDIWAYHPAAK